jgi:hypothetical protein
MAGTTDKPQTKEPTHGERIDALEKDMAAMKRQSKDLDAIKEALASGDPTLIAAAFTK